MEFKISDHKKRSIQPNCDSGEITAIIGICYGLSTDFIGVTNGRACSVLKIGTIFCKFGFHLTFQGFRAFNLGASLNMRRNSGFGYKVHGYVAAVAASHF